MEERSDLKLCPKCTTIVDQLVDMLSVVKETALEESESHKRHVDGLRAKLQSEREKNERLRAELREKMK